MWSRSGPSATLFTLLGPRDRENCSCVEIFGNKRFSTRPSSMGGRGAFTISRRAVPSLSGLPVPGTLALPLTARFDRDLNRRGGLPRMAPWRSLAGGCCGCSEGVEADAGGCHRQQAGWGAADGGQQPLSLLNSSFIDTEAWQEQNNDVAWLRSKKLSMRCTCCLFILVLRSMCIGLFSLHSK